jgi:hypothetical protein
LTREVAERRQLFETSLDLILIVDRKGVFSEVSPSALATLGYRPEWSVEDPRYIPQNLVIMLGALPVVAPELKPNTLGFGDPVALCTEPGAQRSLFDQDCPLVMPIDIGTSLLLSAPGLLISLFAIRRHPLARLTVGAGVTVVLIALFNLAHFSRAGCSGATAARLHPVPATLVAPARPGRTEAPRSLSRSCSPVPRSTSGASSGASCLAGSGAARVGGGGRRRSPPSPSASA